MEVVFVGGLTEYACLGDIANIDLSSCKTITESELGLFVENMGIRTCIPAHFEPDLKVYPYKKSGCEVLLLFNESGNATIDTWLALKNYDIDKHLLIYPQSFSIDIQSQPNQGTQITLTFPAVEMSSNDY